MKRFSRNYWVYWTASVVWSLGLTVYFLVYNLYLLDLGFDEAFIGNVTAAFTLGSLAITLPGGWLLTRFGVKRVVWVSALLTGLALLGRATLVSPLLLQVLAFANGAAIGAWIVATPPFISRSTDPRDRNWAFSLWHGTSIGMGVVAGLLVGLYSRHLSGIGNTVAAIPLLEKRTILLGSIVVTLATCLVVPMLREAGQETQMPPSFHPFSSNWSETLRSRAFLTRLIVVLVLWSLYVGSFPPFFNVFFYRHFQQSLGGIGLIFSFSQLCQVSAVFCMPLLSSWLGQTKTIPLLQFLSAAVLPTILLAPGVLWGGVLYVVYLSFQVMVEPALEAFIMGAVLPEERNLVSSLHYFTLFLVQAAAVWITGHTIRWAGYQILLVCISVVGMASAVAFIMFFGRGSTGSKHVNTGTLVTGSDPRPRLDETPVYHLDNPLVKRFLDLILTVLVLLTLSPLLLLIGLALCLKTPGTVLFKQERIGLGMKRFWIYKFRTMRTSDRETSDARWTRPQDERVTPLGRLLRRTSLDELPQFLNVLRGDMSLVGPRPERPYYVELFRRKFPDYAQRFKVKGGMTGWAQVNGWRGDTSIEKRLEYDLYYLRNWNLWFDVKILFLTLWRGFYHDNAY